MISFNDGLQYESAPIDDKEKETLIGLISIPGTLANEMWTSMIRESLFQAVLVEKRCIAFHISFDPRVKLLALLLCNSPGQLVTYMIDVLQVYGIQATVAQAESLYSEGFYSEKGFAERWDYLKTHERDHQWGHLLCIGG